MKVIDIGAGDGAMCRRQFPDAEIVRLDADRSTKPDIVHDITEPFQQDLVGAFDAVYCSHILEHIDRIKVIPTMRNLASLLKENGDMYLIVPALEWAASELLKNKPSDAVIAHIFGQQDTEWQYHRCGFTLPMLRRICMVVGLTPITAKQTKFIITMEAGEMESYQDVVVARKRSNKEGNND